MEVASPSASPLIALGVLSGTSAGRDATAQRFKQRRDLVRSTWMQLVQTGGMARSGIAVRFVLRCGGLPATSPVRSEADVLCADDISASESRMRGPILALHWWLQHALVAYPNTPFLCKSDDDVFLYMADIAAHLRSHGMIGSSAAIYLFSFT